MRYQPLSAQFHTGRRRAFAATLPAGAVAIIHTNASLSRSQDTKFLFRPDSSFYYLTGIDEPDAVLVMTANEEWLLVQETDEFTRVWHGDRYSREQAATLSGIADVRWTTELNGLLRQVLAKATLVQLNIGVHSGSASEAYHPAQQHAAKLRRRRNLSVESAQPALARLRMIKQPEELAQMSTAVAITAAGFEQLRRPHYLAGKREYQLEAQLTAAFVDGGGQGHAYDPIVASGAGATVLHYTRNDQSIKVEDMVLVDAGVEYGWYAADVTRVYPASGCFNARQRAVYEAVLDVQRAAIKLMQPGASLRDIGDEVTQLLGSHLVDLGLVKSNGIAARVKACKQFMPHGLSHFLGLDVHDVGDYRVPLAPGMVLTCEPGLYLPEEGIGVRLEDDILITANGPVNLTAAIPIEPEAIEQS